jgi:cytochrome P450
MRQSINTNTYKVGYWATAHLLKNPSIRAAVKTEIEVVRQKLESSNTHNPQYLTHLRTQTPQITALFQETLRCYSASSSIRVTLAPVPIGKRIIPAKSVVFIPFRPLHFDPDVFGSNADQFHPERFIEDKKLAGSQSYKPFSSGSSHCPGRVLARMEFAAFIADFLGTYSVEVEGGGDGEVPKTDKKTPTKGLLMPADGEDITLRICKRVE